MDNADTVTQSWRRIDAWLAAYAPAELAMLNPPAANKDLSAVERETGLALPPDVAASLRRHDGSSPESFPIPAARLLSAAGMAAAWRMWMNELDDDDLMEAEPGDEPWWHPQWLPWAETAGGDLLFVDLRPGPQCGRVGEAVHDDRGSFGEPWPSLAAYLSAFAGVLHGGGTLDGWYLYLTADHRLWWDRAPGVRQLHGSPLTPAPAGVPDSRRS